MSSRLIGSSPMSSITTSSFFLLEEELPLELALLPPLLPAPPPSPAPPRKVTSWATTSTLLRFCPSCSQLRDCRRPLTRHGRPLLKYCATRSPSGPQATTSM